jgi:4a-hydroxytetrahydrobiopterin dehydratase
VTVYAASVTVLSDDEVDAAAAALNGWQRLDNALRRSVTFPTFPDAIEGVRRVADLAERADHHPDIDIRWRTVTFALVTHSQGGITEQDVALAGEIDRTLPDR